MSYIPNRHYMHPAKVKSGYYLPVTPFTSATASSLSSGMVYLMRSRIPCAMDQVALDVSAGQAGSEATVAYYSEVAGTPSIMQGSVVIPTATPNVWKYGSLAIPEGVWWFGVLWTLGATAPTLRMAQGTNRNMPGLGGNIAATPNQAWTVPSQGTTMPPTITNGIIAVSGSSPPVVFVRAA